LQVLVASQDSVLRHALMQLLQERGHKVLPANDGIEAWRILQAKNPSRLALIQWDLPGIDAPGLCQRLRSRPNAPFVYIIVLGLEALHIEPKEIWSAGADDYVPRPLDLEVLCFRLHAAEHIIALQEDCLAARQALEYKATHDTLTDTWNRLEALNILEREVARSLREGWQVCVALLDLDYFKNINDTYGHLAGDEALRLVASRLKRSLRPYDIVGRYGGEEFIVILAGCSPRHAAGIVERLRQQIADTPVELDGHSVQITMSAGVAVWDNNEYGDIQAFLRAADAALYAAKRAGRNCVRTAWQLKEKLTEIAKEEAA